MSNSFRWLLPRGFAARIMEAARQSLTTLQGLLDEGFITQHEFKLRRAKIIDSVTAVKPAASSSSSGTTSVFSRLGADEPTGRTSATVAGAWGHDGYESLYGGGKGKGTKNTADLRSKLNKGGDLRSKLSGGRRHQGIVKPTPGGIHKAAPKSNDLRKVIGKQQGKKNMPAKCPW